MLISQYMMMMNYGKGNEEDIATYPIDMVVVSDFKSSTIITEALDM